MFGVAARGRGLGGGVSRRDVRTFGALAMALALVLAQAASCSIDDRKVTTADSGMRTFEACTLGGESLGPWTCVQSNTLQHLHGVWGAGPDEAWAVGAEGTIVHWNGSVWSAVASSTNQDLRAVWGSGPGDVWAVGAGPTIVHWNGSAWSAFPISMGATLNSVWGSSSDAVYAVGDAGWLASWNGTSWEVGKPVSFANTRNLYSVWGAAPNDVWIVGQFCADLETDPGCGGATLLHWNGVSWSAPPSDPVPPLYGAWGSGSGDVWAVGDDVRVGRALILHSAGSTWAEVSPAEPAFGGAHAVWGSGPNDVWVVGFGPAVVGAGGETTFTGTILHFDGATWTTIVKNSAVQLNGIWGSGPHDVWAVADGGMILHHR
jgi:hypothetical protein